LAAYERAPEHGFRIWNLGSSRPISLRELIQTIASITGKEAKLEQLAMQAGDVQRTFADISRAQVELDYQPASPLADGIRAQVEWYRASQ